VSGAEALVMVPQAKELEPLLGVFADAGYRPKGLTVGRLDCHCFDELGLLVTVGGHGKTQLAVQTQHLIEQRPTARSVICAGAAGSLDEQLRLGDVVVGTLTVEHDYKTRFVQRPSPRHDADPALLDEVRLVARDMSGESRVIFGTIASGDEDVIDPIRARELQAETGAVCVAWEGAGAARAARFSGLRFLELRAITDGADHAAAADFHANLARSMPKLGQLLLRWSLGRVRP